MSLWREAEQWSIRPSGLVTFDDPIAALILDQTVRAYGTFIDSEIQRFAQASVEEGKGKRKSPSAKEVQQYAETLITGKARERTKSLREFGKKRTGALVQGPDGRIRPA